LVKRLNLKISNYQQQTTKHNEGFKTVVIKATKIESPLANNQAKQDLSRIRKLFSLCNDGGDIPNHIKCRFRQVIMGTG